MNQEMHRKLIIEFLSFSLFAGSTHGGAKPSPHFDTPHLDNHTVQLGAIAFLPCTIKNLGNKSVRYLSIIHCMQNSQNTMVN